MTVEPCEHRRQCILVRVQQHDVVHERADADGVDAFRFHFGNRLFEVRNDIHQIKCRAGGPAVFAELDRLEFRIEQGCSNSARRNIEAEQSHFCPSG